MENQLDIIDDVLNVALNHSNNTIVVGEHEFEFMNAEQLDIAMWFYLDNIMDYPETEASAVELLREAAANQA
ncbi:hypothetical protein KMW28_27255 [Flammeovirga yaeyamensis]|uniref:Phage protein n=1 Tax=Flammeovirga yaeyamensis TaxID=367791 RepID=A0AAX1NAK5_9BACT|nr:hypothetical protein [Flammeovirga yaeyamensis]MBB3700020.1 hypothetical protein [Flammeovirga yaeyamensis]NMF37542.1 hypothetical protein [Flammeovirga yaeyamensis]QWG04599.1 hypothetical protein KMW28_27255 [Flammeovirga yaeyamensis]